MTRMLIMICPIVACFAASAGATDVGTFLGHAEKLERMGVRAVFATEGKLVMKALEDAGRALRSERIAALAAGRRPAYCPDPNNRADVREVVAALRTILAAERRTMPLKDALRTFYARRYPCPA